MGSYTYKEIVAISKEIKNNVKNKQKTVRSYKWTYYICKAILNPDKDVKKIKIDKAPKPSKTSINKKVSEKQYKALAKKMVDHIEKKHTLPNYLKYGNYKISQRLYTYTFARVLVYYAENKKWDSEITINEGVFTKPKTATSTAKQSTSTAKLHDYMTITGCSGMGQCTGYYCACNSLQQSFYRLTGIKVAEKTIAGVAGTTTSGTDHYGIATAVSWFNKKYNKNIKLQWYDFSELGSTDKARWSKLSSLIKEGAVFVHLLYRDKWGHYEVPKSVGDSNLKILNSLGDQCGGGTYCGYIETRSKSAQKSYIQGISQKSIAVLTL